MAGITPTQFRSLLCSEDIKDIKDIEAGGIHPKTLHAYAESFAEGFRSGRTVALPERRGAKPAPLWGSVAITEAEIEAPRKGRRVVRQGAPRKGRRVVRQGAFSGAHEVTP